jgi:gliding motility-associated-like protein
MKKLYFLFPALLSNVIMFGQCNVNVSAAPSTTITCGQSVTLSAFGQSSGTVMLSENFNSGGFGPGWGSTPGAVNFSNPCSSGGVDGTPHAWMDNNTTEPRTLTSTSYNLTSATAGVTICFDLLYAIQGNAAPCEGPDEPDEGVYLQYSTDNGSTWQTIHYFDPNGGDDPSLTSWHNWCFAVPAAAITSNTIFHWYQDVGSGADYDHWGIDNVQIYQNDVNGHLVWLHDSYDYGVGNPGGPDPTPVAPTTTTTYTAQLTTGTGTVCTETITITVVPPVYNVTVNATPASLCPGDCANITATAQQVISPHTTPTFENDEFDVVSSGSASVNINVQGLNTTSLTSSSITQLVINGFNFSGSSFCSSFGGCPCNGSTISFGQTCNLNTSGFTVSLTSPCGSTITLVPANTATGNYSNTTFVPGGPAFGGTFPNGGTWGPSQPFTNFNGCDPNGVWTLSFNAPGLGFGFGTLSGWSISFDDPAIYGPVTYTWSPTTNMTGSATLTPTVCPPASTTYSLTVATPHPGCPTQVATVPITVAPCSGCTPPTFTVTPPAAVCAPATVNLATTVSGVGSNIVTYHATSADANGDVNPLPSSVVSASGTYYIRVEDSTDPLCFSVQSVTVTINPVPTITVNPPTPAICRGTSVILTASGAATYTWSPGTGLSATTGSTVTASPAVTTTYTVTGTQAGCTGNTTVTVSVTPTPTIAVNPPSPTVCPGTSVNLTASGATTYTWSPATNLSGTTGSTVTCTPAATITYTVTGMQSGCTNDTTVTVTVSPNLVIAVNPAAPTVCPGSSVNLTASGASTYTWSPGTDLSATTGATVTSTPAATITYTVTGTQAGCTGDTTVTITVSNNLVVDVTPPSSTICPGGSVALTASGATTYTWSPATGLSGTSGTNVTASPASTTTYTVSGASGTCTGDTTVTITVAPNPVITVTPSSATVCPGSPVNLTANGATTYTWSPGTDLSATTGAAVTSTPAATITYTVTGTQAGCTGDTTVTITVSNNLVVSVTPSSATVCPGSPVNLTANGATTYTWSPGTDLSATTGANVTSTPAATITYTVTGTQGTCTGDTTVTITVSNNLVVLVTPASATVCPTAPVNLTASGATTYTWSPGTDLSATTGATVTSTPGATITYTVTGTQGTCTGDTTVTITVANNLLVTTNAPLPICPGGSAGLTASGATTYTWTPATGLSATTGASITASPAVTTTYTVNGTQGGCTGDTTVTVVVQSAGTLTITPSATAVCSGTTATLTASGGSNYTWSPGATLSATSGVTVIATPIATTTYTLSGQTPTCPGTTTITVSVTPIPTISLTPTTVTMCEGESTQIDASGATTYAWAPNSNLSPLNPNNSSVSVSPPASITYTVIGTQNGCNNSAMVNVTVMPTIIPNAGVNDTICAGENATLGGSGGSAYSWSPAANLSNPTLSFTSASPLVTTQYVMTTSYAGICPETDTVLVVVNPLPLVNAGPDTTIDVEDAAILYGFSNTPGFAWSEMGEASLNCYNCLSPVAIPYHTTMYILTATNEFGCVSSDTVTIYVSQDYALYVPTAFSPNSDYVNEGWKPEGFGIKKIQIYVFDRWGLKLFEAKDMETAWDGRFKGHGVQEDVYVFKIMAETYSGNKISKVGHVTVVR